jgi:hypothetical protein
VAASLTALTGKAGKLAGLGAGLLVTFMIFRSVTPKVAPGRHA